MFNLGKSKAKMDRLGRVLIPATLRKGLNNEMIIIRVNDKIILQQRKKGAFSKYFDTLALTKEDIEHMDDLIAEGGMMGDYE